MDSPAGFRRRLSRRDVLAALGAGGATATAGCLDRVRSLANRQRGEPASVTVKTTPRDDDPFGIHLAQTLSEALNAAGVRATVLPMEEQALLRSVLVNHDFDLYVARARLDRDPDALRGLLHSRFIGESGWQNPFGYSNLSADRLLERQRVQRGSRRYGTVRDLQGLLVNTQPFTTVAVPDVVNAVRTDRLAGWSTFGVTSALTYLTLDPRDGVDPTARVLMADNRPTRNLNPLAVEFRAGGLVTDLLYEPLARQYGGTVQPWLASTWTWEQEGDSDGERPVATVRLREGTRWHDGRPVTAGDVAFTYRFLADTSLGDDEVAVPAPRFRSRGSLVAAATAVDDRTVRLEFVPSSLTVATRALTVPVLPAHVWRKRSGKATLAGIEVSQDTTEALVWTNLNPVGCGPFRLTEVARDTALVFERWSDHHTTTGDDRLTARFGDGGLDHLELQVVPSVGAGLDLLAAGRADAIVSTLPPTEVPEVGRAEGVGLRSRRSSAFYHVGYNNRRAPFSNPRFRRTVSRLLHRESLVRDVFGGHAVVARTPLAGTTWEPADGLPALPFLGSDGRVDASAAREAFRSIGYQYNEEGTLLLH